MKNYNHLEVAPIYQSCILLFYLVFGLVLLDESRFYTWMQLSGLVAASLVVLLGILVLVLKTDHIALEEALKDSEVQEEEP